MKKLALATITITLLVAGTASAAVDPERNASTPTSWHWWRGQTAAKLDQLAADNGERIVSINVDDPLGTTSALSLS